MALLILRRQGLAEMEPVARWEDGEWTHRPEDSRVFDDYYEGVREEVLFDDFDGPDRFAIHERDFLKARKDREDDGTQVMSDDDKQKKGPDFPDKMPLREQVIRLLRPLTDEIISSAWVEDKIDAPADEVNSALQDLIEWGEVELIATTGIAGRVQVKESVKRGEESVWMAYIASDYKERRAVRIFSTKLDAFLHLKQIVGSHTDDLERVEFLKGVWKGPAGDGYGYSSDTAVLRREPIYNVVRHHE